MAYYPFGYSAYYNRNSESIPPSLNNNQQGASSSRGNPPTATWMNHNLLRELKEEDAFHSNVEDLVDMEMLDRATNIQLRLHQYTLLKHCLALEKTRRLQLSDGKFCDTKGGIIGDKVGAGKSFVILSMVLHPMQPDTSAVRNVTNLGNGMVTLYESETPDASFGSSNLLVIPHNLSTQWFEYTQRFYKTGDEQSPRVLLVNRNRIIDEIENRHIRLAEFKLVIVTNTMYNRLVNLTGRWNLKWQRAIFDEVDNTHFPSCPEVMAEFNWFVTASFGNLIYPYGLRQWSSNREQHVFRASGLPHSGYIKNIFVGLKDHKYISYALVLKNEDAFVDRASNLPEPQVTNIICRTPLTIRVLQGLVSRTIIDSLNAGDIETAIRNTRTGQRRSEDSIITMLLSKWQDQLDACGENEHEKRAKLIEKMETVKNRIREAETCCICMDTVENKTVAPCCSNAYCFKCIHLWLAKSPVCPLCKAPTMPTELLIVDNNVTPDQEASIPAPAPAPAPPIDAVTNTSEAFDKAENLKNLLTARLRDPDAKILIFSSYDRSFAHVHTVLGQMGIHPAYLKGNAHVIRNTLNRYKSGEQRVLFVNVDHYGSGLNLEMTTDVIMFHRFDSEIEKQIIGRAQRPGRWCALKVWYLLHQNELVNAQVDARTGNATSRQ